LNIKGLIDLQINGGFGIDFSYDIVDSITAKHSIDKVSKGLLAHGNLSIHHHYTT